MGALTSRSTGNEHLAIYKQPSPERRTQAGVPTLKLYSLESIGLAAMGSDAECRSWVVPGSLDL